jgi:GAF domain-containing protein/HAMP domain-containing protein
VNSIQSQVPAEPGQRTRSAFWLWTSVIAILLFAGSEIYALLSGGNSQSWPIMPLLAAVPVAFWLLRRGRVSLGILILMSALGIYSILAPLALSGLGIPVALTTLALISGLGLTTLPRKHTGLVLAGGIIAAIASIAIDVYGSPGRPAAELIVGRWIFSFVIIAVFGIYFITEFFSLEIRTKIVLGLILTGAIELGFLSFFAIDRAGRIVASLSDRLETSVRLLAEEQLVNKAFNESDTANHFFNEIMEEVASLAENQVSLLNKKETLSQGAYWDAASSLILLDGGQYGNSSNDPSSVFVPAYIQPNEEVIAGLNTSAYLDFSTPLVLKKHPEILAIYYIDEKGVVRYYPNIELASVLPPDFDATSRPYYLITAPSANPERLTRWSTPYVDATGGGLVVTVASPVYLGDEFRGVVAADIQLTQITEQVSAIKIGQTGYAFMVDDAGHIISMPAPGYKLFEMDPAEILPENYTEHTVLQSGSDELRAITARMISGESGLNVIQADGVETYVTYSPVPSSGYSLALVVPTSEMQGAIAIARSETQAQVQSSIQSVAVILLGSLLVSLIISFAIGQVISAPIQRLTETANRIVNGDLTAQATVASRDEIGALGRAFNTMTTRLRESLEGLEKRVEERTAELARSNESNERRAAQFEAIAQVAHAISSTQNLDTLLPKITTVISSRFDFYHVGIFLLDERGEYAVLSAANSEGGQRMLARNHRLKVGETGIVGYATGTGNPRVALDTGTDAVFFKNPDLPDTRSEMALPLKVGSQIIGALDVQSTRQNAFTDEDVRILSTLADQVSIAIQNARQYEETRRLLAESESLARQFVHQGWQHFTRSQKLAGIRHSGANAELLPEPVDLPKAREAIASGKPQQVRLGRSSTLIVPVKLRGEAIGVLHVRAPGDRAWDQDELDIVTAIVERAAIAMENARLLAETQKRAAKERTIGEISSKLSALSNVEDLMKAAALELGRTMPEAEITIQVTRNQERE